MAEFLTTNGVSYQIENIILSARKKLVLISPYLKLSKTFFERLKDASERGVEIILIYGKDELKPQERSQIKDLKNLKSYYFENLHAKCYLNERSMVITSMNMYEFSEKNNREMGVLVHKNQDEILFQKAVEEAHSIVKSSQLKEFGEVKEKSKRETIPMVTIILPDQGFCIRCRKQIKYNIESPFCKTCYYEWKQYENDLYPEKYCHACGKKNDTSMYKPDCYDCYVNLRSFKPAKFIFQ